MSRRTGTIPADYFEGLYKADADPWQFRTSDYEREKYAATLAALRRPLYADALEVGCSIGVFTALLAPRCLRLLAIDGSDAALDAARQACTASPQVTFARAMVPEAFPSGRYDLIVLSEVLYYLTPADLDRVALLCREASKPGAEIVLCHWLGETDYPQTGTEAAERFTQAVIAWGGVGTRLRDETYRLDHIAMP